MYLIGGITDASDLSVLASTVWRLHLQSLRWEAIPSSSGAPSEDACARRAFHTATPISNHEILVFGGWTGSETRDNGVYVFNATRGAWSAPAIVGTKPEPRQGHSATRVNSADILVYGGWDGKVFCDSLYLLDTCAWSWNEVETQGISPCIAEHTCFLSEWRLVLDGGFTMDGPSRRRHVLDLVTKEWAPADSGEGAEVSPLRSTTPAAAVATPTPAHAHAPGGASLEPPVGVGEATVGNFVVRVGGCSVSSGMYEGREYSNAIWALNRNSHTTEVGPVGADTMHAHAYGGLVHASKCCLLLFGGRDKTTVFGDLWSLMLPDAIAVTAHEHKRAVGSWYAKVHPSLLLGVDREERVLEAAIAKAQLRDYVVGIKDAIEDKDTHIKLAKAAQSEKVRWLKEQIGVLERELEQLRRHRDKLSHADGALQKP